MHGPQIDAATFEGHGYPSTPGMGGSFVCGDVRGQGSRPVVVGAQTQRCAELSPCVCGSAGVPE